MHDKPWLKINSETYIDCIVGNKAGLIALKESIDQALEKNNSKIEEFADADFESVVLTDEQSYEAESIEPKWWKLIPFKIIVGSWLILLPVYGLYKLFIE